MVETNSIVVYLVLMHYLLKVLMKPIKQHHSLVVVLVMLTQIVHVVLLL